MRLPQFLAQPSKLLPFVAGVALASTNAFAQAALTQEALVQESAQETSDAQDEDLARSVRRILHFTSGTTLTGVARFVDGNWKVKMKGGEWQAFPANQIARAPREADVLREKKRRAAAASKSGDLNESMALMEWTADEGLIADALEQANAILDRSPHHEGTLNFLRERALVRVPSVDVAPEQRVEARAELYRWASNAPTAAREIAINQLRQLENQEPVHTELLAGLGDFSVRRRAFSAHAIGRLYPAQDAKRLLQHAVLDPSGEVRRQAAQALGNAEQPGLIVPVVRALGSSMSRVRVQAAEALGYMGYPAAVEPLVNYIAVAQASGSANRVPHGYIFSGKQTAYIQDFDVEVATFQAVADPQINVLLEGEVLEGGVSGVLEYSYATESKAARGSLGRLTGVDAGNTGSAWQRWWGENESQWKSAELKQVATNEN